MTTYTHAELPAAIALLADQATPAPELLAFAAACRALPQGQYTLYDPEQGAVPAGIYGLGGPTVGRWTGAEPGALGYGKMDLLYTAQGQGFALTFGGSPLNSAFTVWVVPAELEGWLASE